jgi:RNA polymerase sigma factor (sigma-70 family)
MKADDHDRLRRERFERLYAGTRVSILGYFLRRVTSPADAADLLAETYLIAWRKLEDVAKEEEARLWLYGVARRIVYHHHRHQLVEQSLAVSLRASLESEGSAFHAHGDSPFADVIIASLDHLKPLDREIIELSAWEQLAPAEIATVVGMKAGAVRVRLHRIRTALRVQLIDAGYPRSDPLDCAG